MNYLQICFRKPAVTAEISQRSTFSVCFVKKNGPSHPGVSIPVAVSRQRPIRTPEGDIFSHETRMSISMVQEGGIQKERLGTHVSSEYPCPKAYILRVCLRVHRQGFNQPFRVHFFQRRNSAVALAHSRLEGGKLTGLRRSAISPSQSLTRPVKENWPHASA